MKKILLILGMVFLCATMFAQEMPDDIKRYDYKEADRYDGAKYCVLKITDCITNAKEYKLRITYSFEENKIEHKVVLFYSDDVVAEIIKTFNYLVNTRFEPGHKDEESFIVCEVGEGAYLKYNLGNRHIDFMVHVVDDFNRESTRVLAGIDRDEIEEFQSLLLKVEKAFEEQGQKLKDAVISDDNLKPLF
jgi:hypothetical protein